MGMSVKLFSYLRDRGVDYEEVRHAREVSASRIAEKVHITGDRLAKAVLVKGDSGFRIAVVPSTCKVDLASLSHMLDERIGLATEEEIESRFWDCDSGALPPLGEPYGVKVCVDGTLATQPEIWFEAGDHRTLVHMSGEDFANLMGEAEHGHIARHM
ncbi:MAG: YbaK/EbsC family protein [Parvibaculum sp.]